MADERILIADLLLMPLADEPPDMQEVEPEQVRVRVFSDASVEADFKYADANAGQSRTVVTNVVELRVFNTILFAINEIANARLTTSDTAPSTAEGGTTSLDDRPGRVGGQLAGVQPHADGSPAAGG